MNRCLLPLVLAMAICTAAFGHRIETGIELSPDDTGLSAVTFLPGTYEYEIYAPGKTMSGKLHSTITYHLNLPFGPFYTGEEEFFIQVGPDPSDQTLSIWKNADDDPMEFEIWSADGHRVWHQLLSFSNRVGFHEIGKLSGFRVLPNTLYYGVVDAQIIVEPPDRRPDSDRHSDDKHGPDTR